MYELHLTTTPISHAEWPAFEHFAASAGAKAMVIELARGAHRLQPMLTLVHPGELDGAIRFAHALAQDAARSGYQVLRCKIEQDAAAGAFSEQAGDHHYFEWHGRVAIAEPMRAQLAALCQEYGGHLSNNAIRGADTRYVTLRETSQLSNLRDRVTALSLAMRVQGWETSKQQWERVVYDSNITLDAGWLERMR